MTDLEIRQAKELFPADKTEAGRLIHLLADHGAKQKEYAEGQARINSQKCKELNLAREANKVIQHDMVEIKKDRAKWKSRHEAVTSELMKLRGLKR